jgi:hypothetical protein
MHPQKLLGWPLFRFSKASFECEKSYILLIITAMSNFGERKNAMFRWLYQMQCDLGIEAELKIKFRGELYCYRSDEWDNSSLPNVRSIHHRWFLVYATSLMSFYAANWSPRTWRLYGTWWSNRNPWGPTYLTPPWGSRCSDFMSSKRWSSRSRIFLYRETLYFWGYPLSNGSRNYHQTWPWHKNNWRYDIISRSFQESPNYLVDWIINEKVKVSR